MKKVCLELYNGDKINLNLYEEYAPITVNNFLKLVDDHFYEGIVFHRVVKNFMSQAGGYFVENGVVNEKFVKHFIQGEFKANGFNNPLHHLVGTISMARADDYNSGTTQFFLCDENNAFLDSQYAAFGVAADEESIENIHKLSAYQTILVSEELANFPDVDLQNVVIKKIYRLEE